MKKIFIFMLTSLLIVSLYNCSKDSSPTPTTTSMVSVNIDGLQKKFSKVEVIQEPTEENGVPRIDIHIHASNPNDVNEYIEFGIGKGDTGDNQLWAFLYVKNGIQYFGILEHYQAGLPNSTTVNPHDQNRIAGTFGGTVKSEDEVNLVLSNGIFDITY